MGVRDTFNACLFCETPSAIEAPFSILGLACLGCALPFTSCRGSQMRNWFLNDSYL